MRKKNEEEKKLLKGLGVGAAGFRCSSFRKRKEKMKEFLDKGGNLSKRKKMKR